MEIRELTRADSKVMRKILLKMIFDLNMKELAQVISSAASAETDEDTEAAGMNLAAFAVNALATALPKIEDDAEAWFASLYGVTVEEYNGYGFSADIETLEQIGARPEAGDFFTRLLAFAKKTVALRAKLEGLSGS